MRHLRLKQANNVGPAGITSMEDGEAGRLVQLGIRGADDEHSMTEMGGRGPVEDQDTVDAEASEQVANKDGDDAADADEKKQ